MFSLGKTHGRRLGVFLPCVSLEMTCGSSCGRAWRESMRVEFVLTTLSDARTSQLEFGHRAAMCHMMSRSPMSISGRSSVGLGVAGFGAGGT